MGFMKEGFFFYFFLQEHNYIASACTTEEGISTSFPMESLTQKWL